MWLFIKHILLLLLIPNRGWEEISQKVQAPESVLRGGYYPIAAVAALSELLRLFYTPDLGILSALLRVIAVAVTLFASQFLAKMLLDMFLPQTVDGGKLNYDNADIFTSYLLGLDCLFLIFINALPVSMTFEVFLPMLSLVVIFRAQRYLDIRTDSVVRFVILSFIAVVIIPLALGSALLFII